MFDLSDKQAMNKGFGDGMSRAFEFIATPALFGGIGYLVDGALGIRPVLTVAFALFGVIGMFARVWYGYDAEMRSHESAGRWNRRPVPAEPVADLWAARSKDAA